MGVAMVKIMSALSLALLLSQIGCGGAGAEQQPNNYWPEVDPYQSDCMKNCYRQSSQCGSEISVEDHCQQFCQAEDGDDDY